LIPEEAFLDDHDCDFHEVILGEEHPSDDEDPLRPGMKIVMPCTICSAAPLDHLNWTTDILNEVYASLNAVMVRRDIPLFHWAPASRRKQIVRCGLRPLMRPTTNSVDSSVVWKSPYVCLSEDPAWAWVISGDQKHSPEGEWDLWQTWASFVEGLEVLPGRGDMGVHEVRTRHRIYKRHVYHIGSRTK
jgi:hypothetical protein